MEQQTIALMIMALMLGASQPAWAQDGASAASPQNYEIQVSPSLDDRFDQCIHNDSCTIRERMNLMSDMSNDMRDVLRQMDKNCAMMDYNECIVPQRDERVQWHKMHNHMREMMQSIEARALNPKEGASLLPDKKQETGESMNMNEPSAGGENQQEKKRFWHWPKFQ